MTQAIYSSKDPEAVEKFSMDFSAQLLGTSEEIVSAEVTITTVFGGDTNPSSMLSGLPIISGNAITQLIQGGIARLCLLYKI